MLAKMRKLGRLNLFKDDQEMPDDAVTLEYLMDTLVIAGTPSSVAEQLLDLREQVGDFGEIVYAGMEWVDPHLAQRSMELMATKVMAEVNEAVEGGAQT
jgi:alkanesulfonate monooxygenase SsuD/methylene tetrahydromethanopterin reductase-like flavin-dependent oxidoreductase (luciferase family)